MHWIEEIRKDIAAIKSSPKELRRFGLLIGSVLVATSVTALWRGWWTPLVVSVVAICGCLFLLVGTLRPVLLKIVHRYWMGFAVVAGSIVSRIILFFLFYFIVTPIGVAARIFKKRFFFSYQRRQSSYWIDRSNGKQINYERMS